MWDWEMNIEQELLKEFAAKVDHKPGRVTIAIRVMAIRDGTNGISVAIANKAIGEWTDSRAEALRLTGEHKVEVLGRGKALYRIALPGSILEKRQVSDTEIVATIEF